MATRFKPDSSKQQTLPYLSRGLGSKSLPIGVLRGSLEHFLAARCSGVAPAQARGQKSPSPSGLVVENEVVMTSPVSAAIPGPPVAHTKRNGVWEPVVVHREDGDFASPKFGTPPAEPAGGAGHPLQRVKSPRVC